MREIVRILLTKMLIQFKVPVFWSPGDCLEDILIALIDNETKRVLIAVYYLQQLLHIAKALIKASKRGILPIKCITGGKAEYRPVQQSKDATKGWHPNLD